MPIRGPLSQECVPAILAFPLQCEDLFVEVHYELLGSVHRGHQSGTLASPPLKTFDLGASPPILGFDLLTEAAVTAFVFGDIDEPHPACFAGAVLVIAAVGKTSPAPVSTGETLLVVKAHACRASVPLNPEDAIELTCLGLVSE